MSRMACTGGTRSWLASRPSAETRRRSPRSFRGGGHDARARASSDADDAAPRVVAGDPPRAERITRRALITLTHAGGVGAALARVDARARAPSPASGATPIPRRAPCDGATSATPKARSPSPSAGAPRARRAPSTSSAPPPNPPPSFPDPSPTSSPPTPRRDPSPSTCSRNTAPRAILREGPGFGNPGALVLDGVPHRLASLHFHTPAENKIDGVTNAMEMHLVHVAADGSDAVAVVGVLFRHARTR